MVKVPTAITGQHGDDNHHEKKGHFKYATSAPIDYKKPKSRPPKSYRDRLRLTSILPNYSGPYDVGTMEIEVPARNPHVVSNIRRRHHHMLQLETVLMIIYYPAAFGAGAGKPPSGLRRWSRETWLPKPRWQVAHAYGKFAGIGSLSVPFFGCSSMLTKLPAFKNAAIAKHWPPFENLKQGGRTKKDKEGSPPKDGPKEPCFPLMIFSHGLGGSRTMYSSLCGEFASYGYVVCAIEHRDGSGPRTIVNHSTEGEGTVEEREEKGHIDHNKRERKRGFDVVDYIFPEGNKWDTRPNNQKGVDQELRHAQVELRLAELGEAYEMLCKIANGDGDELAKRNLRGKRHVGGSAHALIGIDWSSWKGRFHTTDVTLVGHSFGAATCVAALRELDRFEWLSAGIIYDVWGASIRPFDPNEGCTNIIKKPLLAINSEAFSYWKSNFDLVSSLMQEVHASGLPAWLLTLRGTVHITHSDFSLLYPRLCSMALKMTSDPRRAVDLTINASLEFLKLVSPKEIALVLASTQTEGILKTPVTTTLQDLPPEELHPPSRRWTAVRLKIPHELSYRFNPMLMKKRRLRKKHHGNRGLEGYGRPGEELWMHNAPSQTFLGRHGIHLAHHEGED